MQSRGFTIVELLTVIAVIGILIGILIPTVGGARTSAKKAKTKVQFSQWANAIEAFRTEYGYYPNFTSIADNVVNSAADTQQFVQTLSGKQVSGAAMVAGDPTGLGLTAGNTKRILFCGFGADDLTTAGRLQDAFGNVEIVVLMDKNLDGSIVVGTVSGLSPDYANANVPSVVSIDGKTVSSPLSDASVRAGVIFYSAGDGSTALKTW